MSGQIGRDLQLNARRAIELNEQPLGGTDFRTVHPFYGLQGISNRWRLLRANALVGLERMDEATIDLKAILKDNPNNRQALHLLAIAEGENEPAGNRKQSAKVERDSRARQ